MTVLLAVIGVFGGYQLGFRTRTPWSALWLFVAGCVFMVVVVRSSATSAGGAGDVGAVFAGLIVVPSSLACLIGSDRGLRRAELEDASAD